MSDEELDELRRRYELRPTAVLAWSATVLLWLAAAPLLVCLWRFAW